MKKILIISVFYVVSQFSFGQSFETILLAGEDASKLTQNYTEPVVKGLMYNMNSGWYTTAKTHQKFGFDITINPSASFVPSSAMNFDFNPADYKYVTLPNGETQINTIMNDADHGTQIRVAIPDEDGRMLVGNFEMPKGVGKDLPMNAVPLPMVQIGFGLPTRTDIKLRFIPNMKFGDDLKTGLFGIGLQHDIMQYLKLNNPFLNLSVLAAYSTSTTTYNLENDTGSDDVNVSNGEAEFKIDTWTIQALASMDFKLATLYGGLGYNNGSATMKMKGDYAITYQKDGQPEIKYVKDPISMSYEANGIRATLGARLNLGFFKIFADYTFQEYNTASAGIAFSFR